MKFKKKCITEIGYDFRRSTLFSAEAKKKSSNVEKYHDICSQHKPKPSKKWTVQKRFLCLLPINVNQLHQVKDSI